jgi:hypothetical protein
VINRYLRIFFIVAPILGTKSIPAGAGKIEGVRRPTPSGSSSGTGLVCKERPAAGCRNPRENFPMLPTGTTFSASSGVACSVTALATVATDGARPTTA